MINTYQEAKIERLETIQRDLLILLSRLALSVNETDPNNAHAATAIKYMVNTDLIKKVLNE